MHPQLPKSSRPIQLHATTRFRTSQSQARPTNLTQPNSDASSTWSPCGTQGCSHTVCATPQGGPRGTQQQPTQSTLTNTTTEHNSPGASKLTHTTKPYNLQPTKTKQSKPLARSSNRASQRTSRSHQTGTTSVRLNNFSSVSVRQSRQAILGREIHSTS